MQSHVAGVAPAPDQRLLEAEDAQRDAARDQHEPAVVHARRLVDGRRLRDRDQRERDQRDRDVDPEDRAPRPLREKAAERRPDCREPARDPEEERERLAALAQLERLHDDRQRCGEHERAAAPWSDAERDEPRLGEASLRRQPAERRRAGEHDHAGHDHLLVPDGVGEPAAEGEERGEREQVRVDRPLDAGARQPELVLDLGAAIETIVWSMNIIDTAKIIAVRIRFLEPDTMRRIMSDSDVFRRRR